MLKELACDSDVRGTELTLQGRGGRPSIDTYFKSRANNRHETGSGKHGIVHLVSTAIGAVAGMLDGSWPEIAIGVSGRCVACGRMFPDGPQAEIGKVMANAGRGRAQLQTEYQQQQHSQPRRGADSAEYTGGGSGGDHPE